MTVSHGASVEPFITTVVGAWIKLNPFVYNSSNKKLSRFWTVSSMVKWRRSVVTYVHVCKYWRAWNDVTDKKPGKVFPSGRAGYAPGPWPAPVGNILQQAMLSVLCYLYSQQSCLYIECYVFSNIPVLFQPQSRYVLLFEWKLGAWLSAVSQ